ncbi:hypothetical protein BU17DRAFT_90885 [Hysterangium stoloniferum]|nr:hypothetical protein BU17DRAFT_90885 [Hysterangium stoloniferum]
MHSVAFLTVALLIAQAAVAAPLSIPKDSSVSKFVTGTVAAGTGAAVLSTFLDSLSKRDGVTLTDEQKKQILVALVSKARSTHPNKRGIGSDLAVGARDSTIDDSMSDIKSPFSREELEARAGGGGKAAGNGAASGSANAFLTHLFQIFSQPRTRAAPDRASGLGLSSTIERDIASGTTNSYTATLSGDVDIDSLFSPDDMESDNEFDDRAAPANSDAFLTNLLNDVVLREEIQARAGGGGKAVGNGAASGSANAFLTHIFQIFSQPRTRAAPTNPLPAKTSRSGFGSTIERGIASRTPNTYTATLSGDVDIDSLFSPDDMESTESPHSMNSSHHEDSSDDDDDELDDRAAPMNPLRAKTSASGLGNAIQRSITSVATNSYTANISGDVDIDSLFSPDDMESDNEFDDRAAPANSDAFLTNLLNDVVLREELEARAGGGGKAAGNGAASGSANAFLTHLFQVFSQPRTRAAPDRTSGLGLSSTIERGIASGTTNSYSATLSGDVDIDSLFSPDEMESSNEFDDRAAPANSLLGETSDSGLGTAIERGVASRATNSFNPTLSGDIDIDSLFSPEELEDRAAPANSNAFLTRLLNNVVSREELEARAGVSISLGNGAASGSANAFLTHLFQVFSQSKPRAAPDRMSGAGLSSTIERGIASGTTNSYAATLSGDVDIDSLFSPNEMESSNDLEDRAAPAPVKPLPAKRGVASSMVSGAATASAFSLLSSILNGFVKRDGATLTSDQKMQILMALVNRAHSAQPGKREPDAGPTFATRAETGAGGVDPANLLDGMESLFKRESSLNDLD